MLTWFKGMDLKNGSLTQFCNKTLVISEDAVGGSAH